MASLILRYAATQDIGILILNIGVKCPLLHAKVPNKATSTRTSLQACEPSYDPVPVSDVPEPPIPANVIPFFKDCDEDNVCTTDLVLQVHMDISGTG
ncbi:hypothetical protein ABVT39_010089 [Epinephelus coioides]